MDRYSSDGNASDSLGRAIKKIKRDNELAKKRAPPSRNPPEETSTSWGDSSGITTELPAQSYGSMHRGRGMRWSPRDSYPSGSSRARSATGTAPGKKEAPKSNLDEFMEYLNESIKWANVGAGCNIQTIEKYNHFLYYLARSGIGHIDSAIGQ